jgi:phenylacetic acid degradation protein paaN
VIACGSYPAWNAYPAIFANLATGNPVVVKPHPTTILPLARAVKSIRQTLTEAGFDPNLVILAPDTPNEPVAKLLVDHPQTEIVDFTGSPAFGNELENRADRLVFTETAGCNSVILESAHDLDAVLGALARALCLFSGQMCTTPQNIFIPPIVRTDSGPVSYDQVQQRLLLAIRTLVADVEVAAGTCGAIHNQSTITSLDGLAAVFQEGADASGHEALGVDRVLRRHAAYAHRSFPAARTCTPLILQEAPYGSHHRGERFGPVAFLLPVNSCKDAIEYAAHDARTYGAIASYCYTTDPSYAAAAESAFFDAGASIGFNLIRQSPINFTAAFSDYHVTGLNPAGSACLTDLAFVASRFRIVQSKTEVTLSSDQTAD